MKETNKERLIVHVESKLTAEAIVTLNNLLANPHGLYEITRVKCEPKDFTSIEIKEEIRRGEQIYPLYLIAENILPMNNNLINCLGWFITNHR